MTDQQMTDDHKILRAKYDYLRVMLAQHLLFVQRLAERRLISPEDAEELFPEENNPNLMHFIYQADSWASEELIESLKKGEKL